jgi:hypothetical protein
MSKAISLMLLGLSLSLLLGGCGDSPSEPSEDSAASLGTLPSSGELLFVIDGPVELTEGRVSIEDETLEWFTDRPRRQAGQAAVADLVSNWSSYGFDKSAPNAALSATDSEDVISLSDPRLEDDGASFAYTQISGDPPADGESVGLFIDSSNPYRTSMRVYIHASDYCNTDRRSGGTTTVYKNPQVINAPNSWIHEPIPSATFPDPTFEGDPIELFNAAAKKGSVSFDVRYDVHCITEEGNDYGTAAQMYFRGSVGDTFNRANRFTCGYVWGNEPYGRYQCKDTVDSGYHVDADATPTASEPD